MKRHLITTILLVLAIVAFTMRFFVKEEWQNYYDIATFILPTVAALIEIVISVKSGMATEENIRKLKEKQISVHVEGETLVINEGVR